MPLESLNRIVTRPNFQFSSTVIGKFIFPETKVLTLLAKFCNYLFAILYVLITYKAGGKQNENL